MLSERLGKVVLESGMTQADFSAATGIALERLKNLVNGRVHRLKDEEAEAIQRRFGYRDIWLREGKGAQRLTKDEQALLCGDKAMLPALGRVSRLVMKLGVKDPRAIEFTQRIAVAAASGNEQDLDAALSQWITETQKPSGVAMNDSDFVFVPKFDLAASAGNGLLVHDESVVDHLAFKRDWVQRSLGLDPACLALIDARGDSMCPTINSGDLLLLDTRQGQVRSEGVYVINLNGALLVKRIRIKLSGIVDVVSDNPQYGCESVSGEELDRLLFVGRVVWHGRKF